MPGIWQAWFQSAGVEVPTDRGRRVQVTSWAQVVEALQSGDAIGLVDRNFIEQDLDSGRLAIASEHLLEDGDSYYLTYPESAADLPSLQHFRAWLCDELGIAEAS